MFSKIIFGKITVTVNFIRLAMKQPQMMYLFTLVLADMSVFFADKLVYYVRPRFTDILDALDELNISLHQQFASFLVQYLDSLILLIFDRTVVD